MIPSIVLHLVWCLAIVVCSTACQRNEVSEHSNTQVASAQIRYNPDYYPATTMQVTGVHAPGAKAYVAPPVGNGASWKYYHPNAARTGRIIGMVDCLI
ncbi:MAG: hypothetical protein IPI29_03145 [Ignavibacteria bacterium]|nr:hypothetical protein [Ignavibacteria bacterium]